MIKRFRASWLWLHRWIGIVGGILITIFGITGSLLVYEDAIDRFLNPDLFCVEQQNQIVSYDELIAAAAQHKPDWAPYYVSRATDNPNSTIVVVMRDKGLNEEQVFINPYTADVVGERSGLSAMALVRRIHGDLILGPVGENLVGIVSLIMIVMFIAGLVLWWPGRRALKRAVTIKWSGPKRRLLRDLHNVGSIYMFVFLFIATITVPPLVWKFAGVESAGPPPASRSAAPSARPASPPPPQTSITWQEAAEVAEENVPGHWLGFMLQAPGPRGFFMARLYPPGQNDIAQMTSVFISRANGKVIRIQSPQKRTLSSLVQADFAGSLHSGSVAGAIGMLVMFVAGFVFPLLFVTGVWMWWISRRRV